MNTREKIIAIYKYCAEVLNEKAKAVERNIDHWESRYLNCGYECNLEADLYRCQMKLATEHLAYYKKALDEVAKEIERLEAEEVESINRKDEENGRI